MTHIIAVDPNGADLSVLQAELGSVFPKAKIHCCMDSDSALAEAQLLFDGNELFSYAFLETQIDKTDGLVLAEKLKKLFPKIHIVFCTDCCDYALAAFSLYAKGYLLKPVLAKMISDNLDAMVPGWQMTDGSAERDIRIQAFGYFEVFVDGKPIVFQRAKAKELLAYLVDRHGAAVTTEQIASILWEQTPYDAKLKNMVTTVVTSLRRTLKKEGIDDILIKTWNQLSIDISKIQCDAYIYENKTASVGSVFHGEYMSNYSWAECTTGKYTDML